MQILPNGLCQFIDSSGAPLASGTVGFYAPGTLNPLTTYQDQAGTIPNTNPVSLNSRGQALIWGSGIYRQILKDASGVTIWDALTQSSDAAFSGSTGASLIGFDGTNLAVQLQTRVNRVVDSIAALRALSKTTYTRAFVSGYYLPHDGGGGMYQYDPADTTTADNSGTVIVAADGGRWKLGQSTPISFKQFGAKFDGTTDDTVAVQACLASAGPGVLYAPPGTCNTTGGHTLLQGQYIVGAGKNATTFFNTSPLTNTFFIPNTFCGISDLTISGTAARTLGTTVLVSAASHTYLRRLSIFNFGAAGITMNGVVQYIDDCDISLPVSTASIGILIQGGNDQYIRGITFDGRVAGTGPTQCFAGFQATNSGGVWLSDSDFIHAQNGVLLNPSSGSVQFMFFDNVACDTCNNNGWNIATSGTGTINDCAFTGCWGASATNSGVLVTGVANSINGLSFSNFRAIGNGTDGMFIQNGALNVVVNGGLFSGNSVTTTLVNAGIHIGANMGDIVISGVRSGPTGSTSDTQLNQIQVDGGTGNRISIVGCDLQTTRTPVSFLASGTNNTISGCTGVTLKGRVSATTDASGHITVTHNNGFTMGTVLATVQNDGSALFVQWSAVSNTTNFQLKFFTQAGVAAASTGVTFSWLGDL